MTNSVTVEIKCQETILDYVEDFTYLGHNKEGRQNKPHNSGESSGRLKRHERRLQ